MQASHAPPTMQTLLGSLVRMRSCGSQAARCNFTHTVNAALLVLSFFFSVKLRRLVLTAPPTARFRRQRHSVAGRIAQRVRLHHGAFRGAVPRRRGPPLPVAFYPPVEITSISRGSHAFNIPPPHRLTPFPSLAAGDRTSTELVRRPESARGGRCAPGANRRSVQHSGFFFSFFLLFITRTNAAPPQITGASILTSVSLPALVSVGSLEVGGGWVRERKKRAECCVIVVVRCSSLPSCVF